MKFCRIKLLVALLAMMLAGSIDRVYGMEGEARQAEYAEEPKEVISALAVAAPEAQEIDPVFELDKANFYLLFLYEKYNPVIKQFTIKSAKENFEPIKEGQKNAFKLLKAKVVSNENIKNHLQKSYHAWVRAGRRMFGLYPASTKELLSILSFAKSSDFYERNTYLAKSFYRFFSQAAVGEPEYLKFWLMLKIRLRVGGDSSNDKKHLEMMKRGCEQLLMDTYKKREAGTEEGEEGSAAKPAEFDANKAEKAALIALMPEIRPEQFEVSELLHIYPKTIDNMVDAGKSQELENYFLLMQSLKLKFALFKNVAEGVWNVDENTFMSKIYLRYLPALADDDDRRVIAQAKYKYTSDLWLYKSILKHGNIGNLALPADKKDENYATLSQLHAAASFNFCAKNLWLTYNFLNNKSDRFLQDALSKQLEYYEKLKKNYDDRNFFGKGVLASWDEANSDKIVFILEFMQGKQPKPEVAAGVGGGGEEGVLVRRAEEKVGGGSEPAAAAAAAPTTTTSVSTTASAGGEEEEGERPKILVVLRNEDDLNHPFARVLLNIMEQLGVIPDILCLVNYQSSELGKREFSSALQSASAAIWVVNVNAGFVAGDQDKLAFEDFKKIWAFKPIFLVDLMYRPVKEQEQDFSKKLRAIERTFSLKVDQYAIIFSASSEILLEIEEATFYQQNINKFISFLENNTGNHGLGTSLHNLAKKDGNNLIVKKTEQSPQSIQNYERLKIQTEENCVKNYGVDLRGFVVQEQKYNQSTYPKNTPSARLAVCVAGGLYAYANFLFKVDKDFNQITQQSLLDALASAGHAWTERALKNIGKAESSQKSSKLLKEKLGSIGIND